MKPSNARPAACADRRRSGNAQSRGLRPPRRPAREYPPGYFLELVRRHDWPPGYRPQADEPRKVALGPSRAERERQATQAIGWGDGTQPMARTPGTPRPMWMARRPERAQ